MSDTTARLGLPMIRPGQAQKELSHNEALALIDLLTQPNVIGFAIDTPPATPAPGNMWVIGAAPTGLWAGRPHHLAGWTEGGWRFVPPFEGLMVWLAEVAVIARFSAGGWSVGTVTANRLTVGGTQVIGARQAAVANPAGGSVIDIQARLAIAAILGALRAHGLIAT